MPSVSNQPATPSAAAAGVARRSAADIEPTLGEIDMPLSLTITSRSSSGIAPACCSASYGMPAVSAPSPMIATLLAGRPERWLATAMPSAALTEVLEWPAPKASNGLSSRRRKPDRPPRRRSVCRRSRRPVSALCG